MAIKLRELLPDLLLINDPSHISGNRELIEEISQKALDLNFDGLMIESHITPNKALSDAAQQITPKVLHNLLNRLIVKAEIPEGIELKNIDELRNSINYVDDQIIDLLSYRMGIATDIATFKQKNNMTIFQESRWNELLAKYAQKANEKGLNSNFISQLFHTIHQESIDIQSKKILK